MARFWDLSSVLLVEAALELKHVSRGSTLWSGSVYAARVDEGVAAFAGAARLTTL